MNRYAHGVEIAPLLEAVRAAGEVILEIYETDFSVELKGDESPLTRADQDANEILLSYVRDRTPEIPVISEENKEVPYEERKCWGRFWLIDPLDGTKEFIKKNGEFTVNIALVENGVPKLGVVYQPTEKILYLGVVDDAAYKIFNGEVVILHSDYTSIDDKSVIKLVASRSHMSDEVLQYVNDLEGSGKTVEFLSVGSSLKICMVAEGQADVYPRLGPTMEWDTGAAHAVALAAGREVIVANTNRELAYNKEDLLNPYFIVQ